MIHSMAFYFNSCIIINMNEEYKELILEMKEIDQDLRFNAGSSNQDKTLNYLVYVVDYVNGQRIHDLIDQYGFPSQESIGEEGMEAFWLLVQHQDFDVDLQEECLEKCDFSPKNEAYLRDRVRINSGKKQLYGTQFMRDESGELVPQPIEDRGNLDERRKEAGLEPFEEYKEKMQSPEQPQ